MEDSKRYVQAINCLLPRVQRQKLVERLQKHAKIAEQVFGNIELKRLLKARRLHGDIHSPKFYLPDFSVDNAEDEYLLF